MTAPHAIEMQVLDARLHQWGLPRYQSDGAAGIDLHACIDESLSIPPSSPAVLIPAGFALLIGDPCVTALVVPRSGMGHRRGLVLGNSVGVIDSDYTGPLLVSCWNRNPAGSASVVIEPGERIAQLLFVPILRPVLRLTEAFSHATARGAGGFGSTG